MPPPKLSAWSSRGRLPTPSLQPTARIECSLIQHDVCFLLLIHDVVRNCRLDNGAPTKGVLEDRHQLPAGCLFVSLNHSDFSTAPSLPVPNVLCQKHGLPEKPTEDTTHPIPLPSRWVSVGLPPGLQTNYPDAEEPQGGTCPRSVCKPGSALRQESTWNLGRSASLEGRGQRHPRSPALGLEEMGEK